MRFLKHNQKEQSITQSIIDETHKQPSSEIPMTNEEVPGTPFRIVGNHDNGYFVALGFHRLTPTIPNKSSLLERINSSNQDWNFTVNVIAAIFDQLKNIQQTKN